LFKTSSTKLGNKVLKNEMIITLFLETTYKFFKQRLSKHNVLIFIVYNLDFPLDMAQEKVSLQHSEEKHHYFYLLELQ